MIVNKLYFKILCKQLNGIRYKNFCILHKKYFDFKKQKILERLKFKIVKHKLFTEYIKKNYRIIIINLEKITYEIDNIIVDLYNGRVPCWKIHESIRDAFKNKNNHLVYLKSLLNIIQKNLINIKKCKKTTDLYEHTYNLTLIYDAILKNIVGQSVLDIGTCTGILPIIIKKRFPHMKVIGGDICALENAKILSKSENVNVSFIHLNLLEVKKLIKKYDTVVCSHVFEHFKKGMNEKIMTNLLTLTKKRLIVVVPFEKKHKQIDHLQKFNEKKLLNLGLKFYDKKRLRQIKISLEDNMLIIEKERERCLKNNHLK